MPHNNKNKNVSKIMFTSVLCMHCCTVQYKTEIYIPYSALCTNDTIFDAHSLFSILPSRSFVNLFILGVIEVRYVSPLTFVTEVYKSHITSTILYQYLVHVRTYMYVVYA